MMVVAIIVVIAWHVSGLDDDVFKLMPGMLSAFIVYQFFPQTLLNKLPGEQRYQAHLQASR